MFVSHKTSISSDAPSYFTISGVPIRQVGFRPSGRQPRPLSTTRISAGNPFSFLEKRTHSIKAVGNVTLLKSTQRSERFPKPSRLITTELETKLNITRNDKRSVLSLKRQLSNTKSSHYKLKPKTATKQLIELVPFSTIGRNGSYLKRKPRDLTTAEQIGEFERKLKDALISQKFLCPQDKYDVKELIIDD